MTLLSSMLACASRWGRLKVMFACCEHQDQQLCSVVTQVSNNEKLWG